MPPNAHALLSASSSHRWLNCPPSARLCENYEVLASQNPIDMEGTYPLPEAQLDRFMFKLNVTQVDAETLTEIIAGRRRGEPEKVSFSLEPADLAECFEVMEQIHLSRPVASYIAQRHVAIVGFVPMLFVLSEEVQYPMACILPSGPWIFSDSVTWALG